MGDSRGNSGENSDVVVRAVSTEGDEEDDDDHREQDLKRLISSHPLFGLLIESHINCLKVGLSEVEEVGITSTAVPDQFNPNYNLHATTNPNSSDLDKFMEAYCATLNKLEEAIDKPFKETTSFIKDMYAQLKELSITNNADQPQLLSEN